MLYYIKYYIVTEKFNSIEYQMSNEIHIKYWQQIDSLSIDNMINEYNYKPNYSYKPCFIFIKYENEDEKNKLTYIFKDKIINIDKFNIYSGHNTIKENIIIIKSN